jgi:peptidoglycan/xylan/chitin deacetylase (PgdA/CDA1 family)
MVRSSLPQNFLRNAGTVLDAFEDVSGWSTGSVTVAAETTIKKTGTQAMRYTPKNAGVLSFTIKTISTQLNRNGIFGIWMYVDGAVSDFSAITIYLAKDSGFSSYINHAVQLSLLSAGWNYIQIDNKWWTASTTTADGVFIRMKIQVTHASGKTTSLIFDDCTVNTEYEPRLIIAFDDNHKSIDTYAVPYMSARGIPGTRYCNYANVGTDDNLYSTLADLQACYALGWAVANHTITHPDLTTLTEAQVTSEITGCSDWLITNEMPRSAYHMAYPLNANNASVRAVAASCGVLSARGGSVSGNHIGLGTTLVSRDMMYQLITTYTCQSTTTLASVKAGIDDAIVNGWALIIYLHGLADEIDVNHWDLVSFYALIDYIIARGIKCVTIDEWYNGLTNPRYRSIPPVRT